MELLGAGGGGGKGGGGQQRTPQISPDSLESTQYATVVDLISEGEIQGLKEGLASIYLDNTPLAGAGEPGTFTRASVSAPVVVTTSTAHGLSNNQSVYVDFGSPPKNTSGIYAITLISPTSFSIQPTALPGIWWTGSCTTYVFNFSNVTVYTRNGTQAQSYIPVDGVSNTVSVGASVLQASPVIRSISDTSVNRVKVTLSFPQLQEQKVNGDVVGTSVNLTIAVQYNGGGYVVVTDDTVTGRSADMYQREYNIPLTGAFPVDIKVTRVTADPSGYVQSAFNWSSYTEVTDAKFRYPNSALIAMRINAEQFNNIPDRTYRIRGIKVQIPNNGTVDSTNGAIVYSGVWGGTFGAATWTSDPAWVLWDLLVSKRYGFGDHISAAQLDKWAFYAASQYCSALNTYNTAGEIAERAARGLSPRTGATDDYDATTGKHGVYDGFSGYEPRFSCNVNIQTAEEAYTLVNNMASVFRAMPFWSAGSVTISQDRPSDPAYLFTLANVSEEGFSYESSSRKSRPTVAVVKYLDLAARDAAYEVVENQTAIAKYGAVTTQIDAFACTSRGQAHRIGEWLLYSEQEEGETVTFTASIDAGVIVRPGQVISISDPVRAGSRRGGRISSATTSSIVVDNATGLPASGGTLSVILPDGTVQSRTVGTRSGTTVPVTSAFTVAPNPNSVWIWQTNDLQASTWRVLGVSEQDGINYAVTALSYDSGKYDYVERGVPLQARDVSNLTELPAAPTAPLFTTTYTNAANLATISATAHGLIAGDYVYVTFTSGNLINNSGTYTVYATPNANSFQVLSNVVASTSGNVTWQASGVKLRETLYRYQDQVRAKVTLRWQPVLGVNQYVVIYRKDNGNWLTVTVQGPDYDILDITPGVFDVQVYSLNALLKRSATYASASITALGKTAPPSNVANFTSSIDPSIGVLLTWDNISDLDLSSYEIRVGSTSSTWADATFVTRVAATSYKLGLIEQSTKKYHIKAIDTSNIYSTTAATTTVTITAPSAPSPAFANEDATAILSWSASTGSYAIAYYDVLFSDTSIAQVKTTSFSIPITWTGLRAYTVKAVDIAGNQSTAGTANINVLQAAAPTVAATFSGENIALSWNAVNGTTKTRAYRVTVDAVVVATIQSTAYSFKATGVGEKSIGIEAVDANGNLGAQGTTSITITIPPERTVTAAYKNEQVVLSWGQTTGSLPIVSYTIRYGESFAAGTDVGVITANNITLPVTWATRTFWVRATDTAGNVSLATTSTFTVAPTVPSVGTLSVAYNGELAVLSWTPTAGSLPITDYEVTGLVDPAQSVIKSTTYSVRVTWTGSRTISVRARDTAGNYSTASTVAVSPTAAAAPSSLTSAFVGDSLTLNWTAVAGSLPTAEYEVRYGASYEDGTYLARVKTTTYTLAADWGPASRTFWVAAISTNGQTGTAASVATTLSAPAAIVFTQESTSYKAFQGELLVVQWTAAAPDTTGKLDIDYYEVRRGATYASAPVLAKVKTNSYTIKPKNIPGQSGFDWVGTQTIWVVAYDVRGNSSPASANTYAITAPTQPSITQQVIDNNVLLKWNDCTQTLPITYYELRRGSTWATAEVVGTKQGQFTSVFETASGTYTYLLGGYDSAGNLGPIGSVSAQVNQPPDYILNYNANSTFNGTKTNAVSHNGGLLVSVSTTETWQQHFTSRSWNTPQDQVTAGFPVYAQPSQTTAQYVEAIDYGTTLAGTRFSATLTGSNVTGSTTVVPTLATSLNGTTWTSYAAGETSVYATNFRYARVTYDFTSSGGDDLYQVTALNLRLDSKIRNDAGTGVANAGDTAGTVVNFNIAFIDVMSISVTPSGTTQPRYAVYDFVDVANPTSFKVLLFNSSGTRISGDFSWSARGV